MSRVARASLFTLICVLILADANGASAWCQSRSVDQVAPGVCQTQGVPLAWKRRCIGYGVDSRGAKDLSYDEVLMITRASFQQWLDVDCGATTPDFEVRAYDDPSLCSNAEFNSRGRNLNAIAFLSDWSLRTNNNDQPLDPNAIAITSTWFISSGEIIDADILLNEDQGPFVNCAASGCVGAELEGADLQSILTHEIGHFFGVAHSEVQESTMRFDYSDGSIDNRSLELDDETAFCSVYPAGSLKPECSFEPFGGLALVCEPNRLLGSCALMPASPTTGLPWFVLVFGATFLGLRARRRAPICS